jgi:L-threonylcarbamoyladenylate synthase
VTLTDQIAACRGALASGHTVLVPTDTVYGIAAALDDRESVARLYALKGRDRSQPCQVLCFSQTVLDTMTGHLPPAVHAIVRDLLPGTTTCIVDDPSGRYGAAGGADPHSLGIRAPAMAPDFQAIDIPLIATSANDPGGADPTTVSDVPDHLRAGLGAIVDVGKLPGVASAVVDLRVDGQATILRPGPDPGRLTGRLAAHGLRVHTA